MDKAPKQDNWQAETCKMLFSHLLTSMDTAWKHFEWTCNILSLPRLRFVLCMRPKIMSKSGKVFDRTMILGFLKLKVSQGCSMIHWAANQLNTGWVGSKGENCRPIFIGQNLGHFFVKQPMSIFQASWMILTVAHEYLGVGDAFLALISWKKY